MKKDKLLEFLEEYYKEVFPFEEEMVHEKQAYDQILWIINQHFSVSKQEREEVVEWARERLGLLYTLPIGSVKEMRIYNTILKALGEGNDNKKIL